MLFITSEKELNLQDGVSAVYCYASWLNFHKHILSSLHKVEKSFPQVKFYAADIEQFKNLIKRFKIVSLPYLHLTRENEALIERVSGLQSILALNEILVDIYGEKEDDHAQK